MRKRSVTLTLLAVLFVFTGCQWQERAENFENAKNLRTGMTKEQVLEVMGPPVSDETYSSPDLWFYYVDTKWYDGLATEDECMPLVFRHGKLVGWGNNFYNRMRLAGDYVE